MSRSPDYDVIVVGAGHNGLAATALLAGRGLRVLCLEKNAYVGGMAVTREILTGCRNDVGASLLFPLAKGIAEELELARYGVELIDLPIMASNLNSPSSPPAIFYANPFRMARYVVRHFGARAMIGFVRLMAFCKYPASLMDRFTPRSVPPTLEELLDRAGRAQARADPARLHGLRDGSRRTLPARSREAPHAARVGRVCGGAIHLQGPVHARQRAVPRLHVRAERGWRADAAREGRHGLALGGALPPDRRKGRRGALQDAGAPRRDRGRSRDRCRATRRHPRHGARRHLESRQARDLLRAGGARPPRGDDGQARRVDRAARRLRAPALQAAAPSHVRAALRASERRSAHALQHDAGPRSGAAAGELRSVPARRGAAASARRHADPDRDGSIPRARRLPRRDDLRLLLS